jgi:hypothetical protein
MRAEIARREGLTVNMISLVELKGFIILWNTEKLRWVVPREQSVEYAEKMAPDHVADVTNLSRRETISRSRILQGMPETWMCDCELITENVHNMTKSLARNSCSGGCRSKVFSRIAKSSRVRVRIIRRFECEQLDDSSRALREQEERSGDDLGGD